MHALKKSLIVYLSVCLTFSPILQANPIGGAVVATNYTGPVVVTPPLVITDLSGKQMTVNASFDRMVINWNSFSIAADESVRFVQNNSASAVLNRVTGGNPSQLLGQLQANGSVFLINPNGVLVGSTGVIQTGGTFAASTRDIANSAFTAGGDLNFLGSSTAGVQNLGFITSDTGDVILVGRTVQNSGTLTATQGAASLAAGDDVLLNSTATDRLSVRLPATVVATGATGVDNSGTIKAAQAQLTAAGGDVYTLAVSNGGTIEATGVTQLPNGRIVLTSDGGDIAVTSTNTATGKLTASNANGDGGTILIGGGSLGADASVPNARNVTVQGSTARITANATSTTGNGGQIGLWSETTTNALGTFSARGGATGGNGGTVEFGSRGTLTRITLGDVAAPAGTVGTVRYAAPELNIGVNTLANLLPLANLELTTRLAGSTGSGDINITNDFTSSASVLSVVNPNNLTLTAARDINQQVLMQFRSQLITSDPAYASTNGIAAQSTRYGDFTFDAARDINLNQAFSIGVTSTAFASPNGSAPGTDGPDITSGQIKFIAGGNFTSTSGLSVGASSRGGDGYDATSLPPAVLPTGGQGGDITLGAVSVTAGGNVTVSGGLGLSGTSSGGTGGDRRGGGTGGAGGNISMGGMTVTAGGTLQLSGAANSFSALSAGGAGGLRTQTTDSTLKDGGNGGAGGTVSQGQIAFDAVDLNLSGTFSATLESRGGAGSNVSTSGTQTPAGVGTGGNAGNVSGGLSFTASRDILSLAGTTTIQSTTSKTDGIKSSANDGLGGAGGTPGTATLAPTTYTAGRDIASATTANSVTVASTNLVNGVATAATDTNNLSVIAGRNLTLTQSTLSAAGLLTLVADNANPNDPAYGTGAIALTGTQLKGANGTNATVRLFGVDPTLVNLGTFTPAATGTTNQYFGDAGATAGGLYFKAIIKHDPLSITANNVILTYGFTALPAFSASYAGLVNGDTSSVVTGLQFSTTASVGSNVGTYTITPFGASAPVNYTISYSSGTLTINPAVLNVAANNASKTYGAVLPGFTGTATGLMNSDTQAAVVSFAPMTTATAGSNVGTYTIVPNATLLGTTPNYTLGTSTNGTLTINRASLLVSADNLSRAFGSANPALTASFNGLVNGDTASVVSGLNLVTAATPASGGGSYAITQSGSLAAMNYAITFTPGTLIVGNPDYLTIKANNVNLTYGFAALPTFTASYSGLVNGNTAGNVTGLQFFTTASLGANAGSYAITPFGATAPSNYLINYQSGTLTVNPAVLNVAANSASKTYGATLPVLTGTATGLVNSDTQAGVVSFAPVTTATAGSNVGTYAITPGATLLTGNYVLGTQTNGTLNIGTATLNVAANNAATTYGSAIPTLTGSANGLVNSDTQSAVVAFAPTTTATLSSNAGTYVIMPNATLLGATPNYSFGTIANGVLTINPAQLVVSAADATRVYGAANPAFSASATGFVNGDTQAGVVTFAPTTTAAIGSNVGTYFIQPNPTLLSGNYAIGTTNAGLLTITPARLDLAGNTFSMIYGDAGTPSVTATGLANGDKLADVATVRYGTNFSDFTVLTYNQATNSYVPAVWQYLPAVSGVSSNYTLGTVTPGAFTVTPREVTVSLAGYNLSRAVRSWSDGSFNNLDGAASGNQLTVYAGDPLLTNPQLNGQSVHRDQLVFTFGGMKPADLAQTTAQNYSVAPKLSYVVDQVLANGQLYTGPVITGFNLAPGWTAGSNYTFKIAQPSAASLHYLPSTPVTVTMIDIATIMGNPKLNPVYAFTGSGLGALNGMDLTSNRFSYITNETPNSQSGTYWYLAKLPSSIDAGNFTYPSSTTNSPGAITIPAASRSTDLAGAFWWSPLLSGMDLQITQLRPGKVRVYDTNGVLAAANYALGDGYGINNAPVPDTTDTGKRVIGTTTTANLLSGNYGDPSFNLISGSILGYPAYQAQEVYDVVAIFLQRAGQPSDHASVTNWIFKNNTTAGKDAIFGIMTEYIMNLASTTQSAQTAAMTANMGNVFGPSTAPLPVRTPSQQVLFNTIASAVQSNRIAAYQQVEADYNAWQADVAQAKAGKKPTLYSLIDLGETPPASLFNELTLAKTGLSQADLAATGVAVGTSVGVASTGAGLALMAASGIAAEGTTGALMPFATSAAAGMASAGPAIAATFVAVVVADAAVKVGKIEKFKKDLDALKTSAYASTSVEGILNNGTIGQAEILNALRELNGM